MFLKNNCKNIWKSQINVVYLYLLLSAMGAKGRKL